MQSKITEMQSNTKILKEVRKLNDKFTNLESQLLVTKNVNSLLQQRAIDLERQCGANAQYSRRECLEVAGIPSVIIKFSKHKDCQQIFSVKKDLS